MSQKTLLVLVGVVVVGALVLTGFLLTQRSDKKAESPIQKVEELKANKEDALEKSGYNECMRQVAQIDEKESVCIKKKLEEKGHADGINCIQDNENPVCQQGNRYNDQVDADNACMDEVAQDRASLSELDCMSLMIEEAGKAIK